MATLDYNPPSRRPARPSFSIPSIVAVVCVLLVYFTEYFDVLLSIIAIGSGVVGAIMALSPSIRGGVTSIIAIVLGVLSIIASIFQIIF